MRPHFSPSPLVGSSFANLCGEQFTSSRQIAALRHLGKLGDDRTQIVVGQDLQQEATYAGRAPGLRAPKAAGGAVCEATVRLTSIAHHVHRFLAVKTVTSAPHGQL